MWGKRLVKILALGGALGLAACGSLVDLPGSGPAPQIYALSAHETDRVYEKRNWRLLIDEPVASRTLDTDRIAMWTSQVEVNYITGALWSDRAPRLVQGLLVESFDRTGALELVAPGRAGMRAPYLLQSTLQAFQAEGGGRRSARIRIKFVLVEQASADILASKVFEREVRARGAGAKSIVLAFNEALGEIAPQLMDWVLDTIDATRTAVVEVESLDENEEVESESADGNEGEVDEVGGDVDS